MKYKTERVLRDSSGVLVTLICCVHKQIEGIRKEGMEDNIWRERSIKLPKYEVNNMYPSSLCYYQITGDEMGRTRSLHTQSRRESLLEIGR